MSDKAWQGKHSKAAIVKAIANGVDGTKMKAFKDKLKPEEIDAVAAYVKKLK
jgi:mono/diheme cytochrome c family protein